MAAITGALTSAVPSPATVFTSTAGDVAFSITGAFVATWLIERSLTASGYAWVPASALFTGPMTATFSTVGDCVFRVRCLSYTSGEIDYTLTPPAPAASVFGNLPTTSAGLSPGTLWNNGGVLCVA